MVCSPFSAAHLAQCHYISFLSEVALMVNLEKQKNNKNKTKKKTTKKKASTEIFYTSFSHHHVNGKDDFQVLTYITKAASC